MAVNATRLVLASLSLVFLCALLAIAGCDPFPGDTLGGSLGLLNNFGSTGSETPELIPYDVALDTFGRLYVADPRNGRVVIFDSPGQVQGTPWVIDGMPAPEDLALDSSGNIYVTSSQSNEIRVFSPDLSLLRKWGPRPGVSGLRRPVDVAVGTGGMVYILENDPAPGINMYQADGTFVGTINRSGDDDLSVVPTCLAVDRSGNVYAGYRELYSLGSIRKFSSDGFLLSKWPLPDPGSLAPTVLAIGPGDDIYLGDSQGMITRLNTDGSLRSRWGNDPDGKAYLSRPEGLTVASDGTVYVADSFFIGLYTFSPEGVLLGLKEAPIQQIKVNRVKGLAVDRSGFVYVMDEATARLQIFTEHGEYKKAWGRTGRRTGYFYNPQDVAVDDVGTIYVADRENSRIQVFDGTGRVLRQWSDPGVTSLAVTGNAVFSMAQREIRKYTTSGTRLMSRTTAGESAFTNLEAIGLDVQGRLFAADGAVGKIHVFSDSLNYIRSIDFLNRRDAFDNIDMAIDSRSRIYLTDYQDNLVQILAEDGALLRNWSPFPPGAGPTAVAIDRRNDHIYVARITGPIYEFAPLDASGEN
jgi:tripartite motif-containing protein 71